MSPNAFSELKKVNDVKVDLDKKKSGLQETPSKWSLKRALKGTNYELGAEI